MKEKSNNSIDDLLIKYLTGLASKEEILDFENWSDLDENNRDYYRKFKSVWESSSNLKEYNDIDVESSLKNVKKRIDFEKNNEKAVVLWMFARIAAVLVFFFGIYLVFKSKSGLDESNKLVKIEALNEKKTVILPDKTIVTLNLSSSIEYPSEFKGNERRVKFEGEAYFEVHHDKKKPFIIETRQSEVKVVGTAFNLKAIVNDRDESIVVTEGLVLFSGKANKTKIPISLKKGEKGILVQEQNLLFKEENRDLNFMSWKTGVFEFNNSPLTEALIVFSGFYKCNFKVIDSQLNSYQISGKYEKLKLEELIEVLELTIQVKIEKSGQTYLIKEAK